MCPCPQAATERFGQRLPFLLGIPHLTAPLGFRRLVLYGSSDLSKVHFSPLLPCQEQQPQQSGWEARAAAQGQLCLAAPQSLSAYPTSNVIPDS